MNVSPFSSRKGAGGGGGNFGVVSDLERQAPRLGEGILSVRLAKSRTWTQKVWPVNLSGSEENDIQLQSTINEVDSCRLSKAKKTFVSALMGEEFESIELNQSILHWYTERLERKIVSSWDVAIAPLLCSTRCSSAPDVEQRATVFELLTKVATQLRRLDIENIAVVDIVHTLYNEKVLVQEINPGEHDFDLLSAPANQFVFASIGWMTMLYDAKLSPTPYLFETSQSRSSTTRTRRRWKTRHNLGSPIADKQPLEHNGYSITTFLTNFGNILPESNEMTLMESANLPVEDRWIKLSLVNFRTLRKVGAVKIEWVENLNEHLDFDNYTRVLKIFGSPSICLVMCCGNDDSILSQIFGELHSKKKKRLSEDIVDEAREYYREVLLSYRLIFAQTHGSYSDFRKKKVSFRQTGPVTDPILNTICSQDWRSLQSRKMFDQVEAGSAAAIYEAYREFPYLSTKLLALQRYIEVCNPNTISTQGEDRRDLNGWWVLWAFVLLSALSLVVSLAQFIPQVVQVFYAKQALKGISS